MANELKFYTELAHEIAEITGTDPETIYTADDDNDRSVSDILVTTDDDTDQTLTLKKSDGTTTVVLGVCTITGESGTDGTNPAASLKALLPELFNIVDGNGNYSMEIMKGWSLIAEMGAVSVSKTFQIITEGASE